MEVAPEIAVPQLCFRPLGAIGRVRSASGSSDASHQQVVNGLALVHGGVADIVAPDQLVPVIHIDVDLMVEIAAPLRG